ncbi:MAG: AI-2E family transporter YdiK [Betaproteobacteria bacterium]
MREPPFSQDYPRVLLIVVLVVLLIACSLWILQPFIPAFIWAAMIVVATWRLMLDVERHVGGRRAIAATFMTVGILLLLVVPIAIAIDQFVNHFDDIRAGIGWLTSRDLPPPPAWVARIPLVGETLVAKWSEFASADPLSVLRPLLPYAGNIATWLAARAGSVGLVLVNLLMIVAFSAILYLTGESAATSIKRFAQRLAAERGLRSVELAGQAVRAVALGVVVTAVAQSVLAGVGLAIAGVPNAVLLTAVMFVLCLAQIGAVPILAPAAIWLFWKDAGAWAVFLLVWCVIVSALDNFLRPVLIRRGADLPLLLVMVGVIGGLLAFGIVGLFIGPVVLAVTFTLANAWIAEDGADDAPARGKRRAAPRAD